VCLDSRGTIGTTAAWIVPGSSGVAYVVSKFGLAGLTQSINAEERMALTAPGARHYLPQPSHVIPAL
jgi:hypothetical protein